MWPDILSIPAIQHYVTSLYSIRFLEASAELLSEAYVPPHSLGTTGTPERLQIRTLQACRAQSPLKLLERALEILRSATALSELAPSLVSGLYSSAFTHYMDAGRYDDAFDVITNSEALRDVKDSVDYESNPRLEHLQRMVLLLCENGRLDVLCRSSE